MKYSWEGGHQVKSRKSFFKKLLELHCLHILAVWSLVIVSKLYRMNKNKVDSLYVKKKWNNKHSFKYNCRASSYGGWWTPPLTKRISKQRKLSKKREVKHELNEWMEMGWMDYEITREYESVEDIVTQCSDEDDANRICQSCCMGNSNQLHYCEQCNAPYYGYQNDNYGQKYATTKPRISKKKRYPMKSN